MDTLFLRMFFKSIFLDIYTRGLACNMWYYFLRAFSDISCGGTLEIITLRYIYAPGILAVKKNSDSSKWKPKYGMSFFSDVICPPLMLVTQISHVSHAGGPHSSLPDPINWGHRVVLVRSPARLDWHYLCRTRTVWGEVRRGECEACIFLLFLKPRGYQYYFFGV